MDVILYVLIEGMRKGYWDVWNFVRYFSSSKQYGGIDEKAF